MEKSLQALFKRRSVRHVLVIAALLLCYSVAGIYLLPWWLSKFISEQVQNQINRTAQLGDISFNPFDINLTLNTLKLNKDTAEMASLDKLVVDIAVWQSITNWALVIESLQVDKLSIYIKRDKEGKFDFNDIIEKIARENEKNKKDTTEAQPFPVLIKRSQILLKEVSYTEQRANGDFTARFLDNKIDIENIRTLKTDKSGQAGKLQIILNTATQEALSLDLATELVPLTIKGTITGKKINLPYWFNYVEEQFNFNVTSGEANFQLPLDFTNNILKIDNSQLNIQKLQLQKQKNDGDSLLDIGSIESKGITLDTGKQTISIASTAVDKLSLSAHLAKNRTINLVDIFKPRRSYQNNTQNNSPTAIKPAAQTTTEKNSPWKIQHKLFSVSNSTITLIDESTEKPAKHVLQAFALDIKDFDSTTQTLSAHVSSKLASGGQIDLAGPVQLSPFKTSITVDINKLDLLASEPYWPKSIKVDLKSGTVSARLLAEFDQTNTQKNIQQFSGNITLENIYSVDKVEKRDFINWKSVIVEDLKLDVIENKLHIPRIMTEGVYARLIINENGRTNIQNILGIEDKKPEATADKPVATAEKKARNAEKPVIASSNISNSKNAGFQYQIDDINLNKARSDFSDYNIKPRFSMGIYKLQGHIRNLGSTPDQVADLDLKGEVDDYAPAIIKGSLIPVAFKQHTDITVSFRNIEMTTFTPYSGIFAGYEIKKGKLTIDLHYNIQQQKLQAENHIFIDNLTLGDEVKSAKATSLPLKLAIALLQNNKGEIDLDIPLSGNFDDPQFSVGSLILKTIGNLMTKIVTSPFTLLNSLIDNANNTPLDQIHFAPGSSVLGPAEIDKIKKLSQALTKRPALRLEISGAVERILDDRGLREQALQQDLLTLWVAEEGLPESRLEDTQLPDGAEEKLLPELYKKRLGKSVSDVENNLQKNPQWQNLQTDDDEKRFTDAVNAAMRQALLSAQQIDDADLKQLAVQRANGVRKVLANENIAPERLYLTDVKIRDNKNYKTVVVNLQLSN